jgi:chaperonin GroES
MDTLNLTKYLTLDEKTIKSPNLCDRFSREDLDRIGAHVVENYKRDKHSREAWERRTEAAMNLAMQVQEEKSFPWPNCANIAFPLVTIAAMQFHSRAYPAIVNGRNIVQVRVVGPDDQGMAAKRAKRISDHMSYQLLEEDEGWEEGQDRALLNVAIVGVGFKKTYWNASVGHLVSEFVPARDLVVNYWARSIEGALVKTHLVPLYRNDIRERVMRGSFYDCIDDGWYSGATEVEQTNQAIQSDNRAGLSMPQADEDTPFIMLEQHLSLDLDCDGYAEPYIITVEETSGQVLRIVTRFDRVEDIEYNNKRQIIKVRATEFFTKIPFIPSPDGGIMDVGFGMLLGPLNESVNSALNQMFDAGTLANTAGGFLGRGAKIRGGVYQFQPFGWNRVDSTGDDLRKNIYPLPVREPSVVMFNLLNLLIEYTDRISGATDMMVGENPGQNTPAETSRAMLEQGQKIYSAIFKRIWRSLKQEFKKVYTCNAVYLPPRVRFGETGQIGREDYTLGATVVPAADPTISSDAARFARATIVAERAGIVGGYKTDETERMFLRELGIDAVDQIFVGTEGQQPPEDVKVTIQRMRNEVENLKLQQSQMQFVLTMQENQRINSAKIAELIAKANKLDEEAETVGAKAQVEAFRAAIEAMREQHDHTNTTLDRMMETVNANRSEQFATKRLPELPEDPAGIAPRGGIPGLVGPPSNAPVQGVPEVPTGIPEGVMG